MKFWFCISIVLVATLLAAQFTDPINISGFDNLTQSSGQNAYEIVDDTVYITYLKEFIYFAKIEDENTQTHSVVDGLSFDTNHFTRPAIEVLDNGNIVIVYSEVGISNNNLLKVATSIDDGQSFDIDIYFLDCFKDAYITQRNDEVDICFTNAAIYQNLTDYMYFTNTEKSENEDGGYASSIVKFHGPDELYGPVHSNDDIWIMNSGGWPTFHDLVTTTGRIMDFTTMAPAIQSAPLEQIFLGGFLEEVTTVAFDPSATEIRQNSLWIGEDKEIVYVKLGNGSCEVMYADITTHVDTFGVYSWYPHTEELANAAVNAGANWFEESDQIWTNYVTIKDTVWTSAVGFSVLNQSVFIPDGELWIEGEVYGRQTWACAKNIYIVGDITYANTTPGLPPDDPDDMNITDYFGLVSEEKIFIKYKHKDPFNNMVLRDDNCDDVMLYGVYAAIGEGDEALYGDMACHYDGMITFEYQHPHGSTPDFTALSPYTLQETLYTNTDLHKYIYPQSDSLPPAITGFNLHGGNHIINSTCGFPYEDAGYIGSYPNNNSNNYFYPYGTDHPWYNPVWPESSDDIVFERGDLVLYGSFIQRRRGYIHRSGSDPYNHPNNEWELENFHYDGTHGSTGYDKEYHYDSRLLEDLPPFLSSLNQQPFRGNDIYVLNSTNSGQNFTETYVEELDGSLETLLFDSDGENVMIAYQKANARDSLYFLISFEDSNIFERFTAENDGNTLKSAHILGDEIFLLMNDYDYGFKIYKYHIGDPILEFVQYVLDVLAHLGDMTIGSSGAKVYIKDPTYHPEIIYIEYNFDTENGSFMGMMDWNYNIGDFSYQDSEISIKLDSNNKAYTTILKDSEYDNLSRGDLYLISGELEGIVEIEEDEILTPKTGMNIYPNPFNPETTITFSLATENTENAEINIYNVKGQKVRSFTSLSHPELIEGSVVWNGRDMNDRAVSTGVYIFELRSKNSTFKTMKGLLLK